MLSPWPHTQSCVDAAGGHFFHSLCCCLAPHGSEVNYLFFILFFEVFIAPLTACPASAEMKLQGLMSRLMMVTSLGTCTALPRGYWKAEAGMLTDINPTMFAHSLL